MALLRDERFAEALAGARAGRRDRPRSRATCCCTACCWSRPAGWTRPRRLPPAARRRRPYADAHHLLGVCLEGAATPDVADRALPAGRVPRSRVRHAPAAARPAGPAAGRRPRRRRRAGPGAASCCRTRPTSGSPLFGGGFGPDRADRAVPGRARRLRGAPMSRPDGWSPSGSPSCGASSTARSPSRCAGTTSSTRTARGPGRRPPVRAAPVADLRPAPRPAVTAAARPAARAARAGRVRRDDRARSTTWPRCSGTRSPERPRWLVLAAGSPPLGSPSTSWTGTSGWRRPRSSPRPPRAARLPARHGRAARRHPADRRRAGRPGRRAPPGRHTDPSHATRRRQTMMAGRTFGTKLAAGFGLTVALTLLMGAASVGARYVVVNTKDDVIAVGERGPGRRRAAEHHGGEPDQRLPRLPAQRQVGLPRRDQRGPHRFLDQVGTAPQHAHRPGRAAACWTPSRPRRPGTPRCSTP